MAPQSTELHQSRLLRWAMMPCKLGHVLHNTVPDLLDKASFCLSETVWGVMVLMMNRAYDYTFLLFCLTS